MIRKLAVLTVFSVSALLASTFILAEEAIAPVRAPLPAKPNDKLLNSLVVSQSRDTFEEGMAEAGWDIRQQRNLIFYNVRQIIARHQIESLQGEINSKLNSSRIQSRSADTSA